MNLAAEATPVTGLQKLNALITLVVVLAATALRGISQLDDGTWGKTVGAITVVFLIGPAAVGLVNIWTVASVAKAGAAIESARRAAS